MERALTAQVFFGVRGHVFLRALCSVFWLWFLPIPLTRPELRVVVFLFLPPLWSSVSYVFFFFFFFLSSCRLLHDPHNHCGCDRGVYRSLLPSSPHDDVGSLYEPRDDGSHDSSGSGASIPRCSGAGVPRCSGAGVPRCSGASVPRSGLPNCHCHSHCTALPCHRHCHRHGLPFGTSATVSCVGHCQD